MKKGMAGYTLLEVLIAVCMLSVGLLGFAQAQLTALRANQAACLQSIAQIRLLSLAEMLQASAIIAGSPENTNSLINSWNKLNQQALPSGKGALESNNDAQVIYIRWQTTQDKQAMAEARLLAPLFK